MRHCIAAAGFAALGMANNTSADVLARESFEYASATLAGANGGTGWSSSWKSNPALTTDSAAAVITASLSAPPNYVQAPAGGSAKQVAMLAYRGLVTEARIDLAADQDYYISFLAARTADPTNRSYSLQLQAGTSTVLNAGTSTGGTAFASGLGATVSASNNTVGVGPTVLWVIKIAARSTGNDQMFVQVYASGQSQPLPTAEPSQWLVTSNTAARSEVLTQVLFATGSGGGLHIDEIRIGTAWGDVVAVPEPACAALFLAVGAAMMTTRSRPAA